MRTGLLSPVRYKANSVSQRSSRDNPMALSQK
jgi:hypothetical protein